MRAEYQLLTQAYQLEDHLITVSLHNPIEETLLENIKSDLTTFIRSKLHNQQVLVQGKLIQEASKKMIYTNREKFEYLVEQNPLLKTLKDRLGLDPDF